MINNVNNSIYIFDSSGTTGGYLPTTTAIENRNRMADLEPMGSFDSKNDMDISNVVNRKLYLYEENIIITVFLGVIIMGFFGNILVIWTVIFNKHMRTSNNLFILNLAISDMTLCVFSIPFNAYKTLRHTWIFGEFLCKFAPFFQATNVFVSTMSITAIALDR